MTARMSTKVNGTFQPIVTPLQHCQYRDTCGAEKRIRRVKIFSRRFLNGRYSGDARTLAGQSETVLPHSFAVAIPRERRTPPFFPSPFFSLFSFFFFYETGQQVVRTKVSRRNGIILKCQLTREPCFTPGEEEGKKKPA